MLNEAVEVIPEDQLKVLEGIELSGQVNVSDEELLANVQSAILRPYPQMRPGPPQADRICLVGSGPSLASTERELRDLMFEGAKVVTVNGAYHWCLERNIRPSTQIVMDARPSNKRFVEPVIPQCRYVLASQCAPAIWDAVEGRENVWMFHAAAGASGPLKDLLDKHYLGQWFGMGGGTTVVSRAISMLRAVGYLRFDLFGVDSCWMEKWRLVRDGGHMRYGTSGPGAVLEYASREEAERVAVYAENDYGEVGWQPVCLGIHHAFPQPENAREKPLNVSVHPSGRPDMARLFKCSPWHIKQVEDFLQLIRINGDHFLLNIHGDGLLAYVLRSSADVTIQEEHDSKESIHSEY